VLCQEKEKAKAATKGSAKQKKKADNDDFMSDDDDSDGEGGWVASDDEDEDEAASSLSEDGFESSEESGDDSESSEESEDDDSEDEDWMADRSNSGCFQTTIKCPKCRAGWGKHLKAEGSEALYTQLMCGKTQVSCQQCLFGFGVITAGHHCPHCDKSFMYEPGMFHEKVTCENSNCRKSFGFMLYKQSAAKARESPSPLLLPYMDV